MISARRPSSIMMTYSYMSALRYDPGMLNTATYPPSCALITAVRSSDTNDIVGNVASSFFYYFSLLTPVCT